MSMFTEIVHPLTHEYLQIKAGNDNFERFSVGDLVPWRKGLEPGDVAFGDGVYEAYGPGGEGIRAWVIIKNHQVLNVLDFEVARESHIGRHDLEKLFGVEQGFERSWWTESEWAVKGIKDADAKLRECQEEIIFLNTLIGKTDAEIKQLREARFTAEMSGYIVGELKKESFARQIFPVQPA